MQLLRGLLHRGQALALCRIALAIGAATELARGLGKARVKGPTGTGGAAADFMSDRDACLYSRRYNYSSLSGVRCPTSGARIASWPDGPRDASHEKVFLIVRPVR